MLVLPVATFINPLKKNTNNKKRFFFLLLNRGERKTGDLGKTELATRYCSIWVRVPQEMHVR